MKPHYKAERDFAVELDSQDELHAFVDRFYKLKDTIYMDGNSLGLLSKDAEASLLRVLDEWKNLGIDAWMGGGIPWFRYAEHIAELQAPLMGAMADELSIGNSTTVNLHALVRSLFAPSGKRNKILMDQLNFPSDIYAVEAILRDRGLDPKKHLVLVPSADGRVLDEHRIIEHMNEEIAIALFPSVLYRSGQLLDIPLLTESAHRYEILIGFDCSHSAGAVPHFFDRDNVDFAFWCNYKYFNNGPGGTASLYLNRNLLPAQPSLAGWWGYNKARQFDMKIDFEAAPDAGAFQIGTPHLLSTAPLEGSLKVYHEAGIENLRRKSLELSSYMIYLIDTLLPEEKSGVHIGTPRDEHRRGGHVAIEHVEAVRINEALKQRGVLPDFRAPNIIRLAPVALYTTFSEVWDTVWNLKEIIEKGEYHNYSNKRGDVA